MSDDRPRQVDATGHPTEVSALVVSNRRGFFAGVAASVAFACDAASHLARAEEVAGGRGVDDLAGLEDYWAEVRRAFDADRTLINLNHGGVAPAPAAVLESMIRDLRTANVAPAHQMWDLLEPRVESVRRELAREFGCDPEELADHPERIRIDADPDIRARPQVGATRSSSPTRITGGCRPPGTSGPAATAWWSSEGLAGGPEPFARRCCRPVPRGDVADRTRVVEVAHVINLTGNVLPVRELVAMARERGCRDVRGWGPRLRPLRVQAATTWVATTTPPASTSGCWPRSGPASSTSGRGRSPGSGR